MTMERAAGFEKSVCIGARCCPLRALIDTGAGCESISALSEACQKLATV